MTQNLNSAVAVIGIDIGKNFTLLALTAARLLRQKWSRQARLKHVLRTLPPCVIGMKPASARHLSRVEGAGHDARLMPAKRAALLEGTEERLSRTPRRSPRRCSGRRW